MSAVQELVNAAINRVFALMDYNIHNDIHKQHEFYLQTVLDDKSLTKDVKNETIRELNKEFDRVKVHNNSGAKRICENCYQECLATLYCEFCVRNHLKANFSNWTSGNADIDNLIQECQMKTLEPGKTIEWIPYNNLQNIKYMTKGGCSEIYTAEWIDGRYFEWDSKKQQLKREYPNSSQYVVLKKLENVENANQSWLDEAKSHLSLSSRQPTIVQCYGLTQDLSNGNYMLVMKIMDIDLRNYLQRNHNQLTWKERIQIAFNIIDSLDGIRKENAIHRDLHSGNILFKQLNQRFAISDFGFCGPADKPLKSIYGNLPYIAPEVIVEKEYTFKSDIYSVAMLMWEISSGKPPFDDYEHDYYLAMNIVNGMRPKIVSGTPLEYESLMEQCWDADPLKRPNIKTLRRKIREINLSYQIKNEEQINSNVNNSQLNKNLSVSSDSINSLVRNFSSKIYNFKDFPNPKNATKEERVAYHSKQLDLSIPDKIESKYQDENDSTMIIGNIDKSNEVKSQSKRIYSNSFDEDEKEDLINNNQSKKLKLNNNNNEVCAQYTYDEVVFQKNYIANDINDEEIYNNPNLHSEEQDELEIPDDEV